MPDETNELLRQILDLQRKQAEEIKQETQRRTDLWIQYADVQKTILRRHFIGIVVIAVLIASGIGIALSMMAWERRNMFNLSPYPIPMPVGGDPTY